MKIADEDAVLINNLYLSKGWGVQKLFNEFPDKDWKLGSIDYLLKKIRKMGTVNRQPGSDRPRWARTDENIETVEDLVLSQEDKPKTHRFSYGSRTDENVFAVEPPTIHFAERSGLRAGRNQEPIHSTQPSATHALDVQQVRYGVGCRVKNGCD